VTEVKAKGDSQFLEPERNAKRVDTPILQAFTEINVALHYAARVDEAVPGHHNPESSGLKPCPAIAERHSAGSLRHPFQKPTNALGFVIWVEKLYGLTRLRVMRSNEPNSLLRKVCLDVPGNKMMSREESHLFVVDDFEGGTTATQQRRLTNPAVNLPVSNPGHSQALAILIGDALE
jgi:hypothetical protein